MRTFIAIPIPGKCKEILNQMQQALCSHKAEIRWVSLHSVHLTLKFLGEVDPVIVPQLATSLQSECRALPSIFLRLHGLGCFPNPGNPRVIWCGIEGDMKMLSQVQRLVGATCQKYGFASEGPDYIPHLTLGRVMGKRNLKPLMDCIKIGLELESSFCAEHFSIYRSDLRPQGAIYTVLNTIALNP